MLSAVARDRIVLFSVIQCVELLREFIAAMIASSHAMALGATALAIIVAVSRAWRWLGYRVCVGQLSVAVQKTT